MAHPPVKLTLDARGRSARVMALLLAGVMSSAAVAQSASGPALPEELKAAGSAIGQAASTLFGKIIPGAGTAPIQPVSVPSPAPAPGAPMSGALRALFAKGTVTGADLYASLKAIKQEARERRSAQAWAAAYLAADKSVEQLVSTGSLDLSTMATTAFTTALEQTLKQKVSSVGMQALDQYLQMLLEDTAGLASESIKLPSAEGMTEAQAKRVVTLATLIVAARLTEKVVAKANHDLATLQTDYKSLLSQREAAGKLLFELIGQRRTAQRGSDQDALAKAEGDLKMALSYDDIRFIDQQLLSMTMLDFSKDMAAQNLALKLLRKRNPTAFADYDTQVKGVLDRTRSYFKAVNGAAAFSGLLINFARTANELGREKNLPNLLQVGPLAVDFLMAAGGLGSQVAKSAAQSLQPPEGFWSIGKRPTFVVTNGEKRDGLASASDVFKALDKAGVKDQFSGALFRNDTPGWLAQVHECEAPETGRMIDDAVPEAEREAFASAYLGYNKDEAKGFSFLNALTLPGTTDREKRLGDKLLRHDHRRSGIDDTGALGQVQSVVGSGFGIWGDQQLIRLTFANRDGAAAAYATLEVGPVAVRPVPSADSVFVYESLLEGCRKAEVGPVTGQSSKPLAPTKPPRPSAKPAGK